MKTIAQRYINIDINIRQQTKMKKARKNKTQKA